VLVLLPVLFKLLTQIDSNVKHIVIALMFNGNVKCTNFLEVNRGGNCSVCVAVPQRPNGVLELVIPNDGFEYGHLLVVLCKSF
jgi:hypothetical protein